jgi:hypothetical protein
MRPLSSAGDLEGSVRGVSVIGSHVPAFVEARLQNAPGASLAAKDLRAAYEAWCATHGYQPLTVPKGRRRAEGLGLRQVEELWPDAPICNSRHDVRAGALHPLSGRRRRSLMRATRNSLNLLGRAGLALSELRRRSQLSEIGPAKDRQSHSGVV